MTPLQLVEKIMSHPFQTFKASQHLMIGDTPISQYGYSEKTCILTDDLITYLSELKEQLSTSKDVTKGEGSSRKLSRRKDDDIPYEGEFTGAYL
jgi:hypothetical protein